GRPAGEFAGRRAPRRGRRAGAGRTGDAMTKEEILRKADEWVVRFVRLQFSDIMEIIKNVAIPRSQLERALDNQIMFDGSSIQGFTRIEESDMNLRPDPNTSTLFPWREDKPVARMICDVYKIDGKPFEGDPRYVLKRAVAQIEELGYTVNFGPECEFFLFKADPDGAPLLETH